MKLITVLTRKSADELSRVTSILGEAGVNIEDIDAERLEEEGVIVLTVDKYDTALRAISSHGLRAITQSALIIRLEDRPGALALVAKRLRDAAIDVRSMHILRREGGHSMVSLVTTDNAHASGVLADLIVASQPPSAE
jgi:hypothetical protein